MATRIRVNTIHKYTKHTTSEFKKNMTNYDKEALKLEVINKLNDNEASYEIKSFIAECTGLKKTRVKELFREFRECHEQNNTHTETPVSTAKNFTKVETKDSATLESKSKDIKTLEDLLTYAAVDLDVWEVERFIVNKWEMGAKDGEDKIVTTPLFQVKVWLKKRVNVQTTKDVIKELIESMGKHAPSYKTINYKDSDKGHLLEIDIPDAHISKLAWGKETGQDYDTKIAKEVYMQALHDLISKSKGFKINKILFPVGNDFFHVDNQNNTTTAGTPLDSDTRWKKSYTDGVKLLVEAIDYLQTIAPVDVLVVPGNHDNTRCYYMGEYLSAWYKDCANVTINNEPKSRKYYTYGLNLIGFSHGNEEKHKDLPLIMATEEPVNWGTSKYRFFKLGHLHTRRDMSTMNIQEFHGVKVSILPSLSGTDAWHFNKGYIGNTRSAEAFVYHQDSGQVANITFNL